MAASLALIDLAVSSFKCNGWMMAQLRIDFQGRRKVETFSRARVQAMRDGVQLVLGVARQVCALGQVLAQQAIGVLIGTALPGAVRIGKDELDRELLGPRLVLGHLVPSIIRQGFAQQRGHVPEFLREAYSGTPRIRPVHPGQENQACGALHQRPDRRAIASPLDQVAFPVAWHRAGSHLRGARSNRRHIENLASSIRAPRPRSACLARLTQRRQQFTAQGTAGQHIQAYVDGLVESCFRLSSGYARRRRPAICSGEPPSARCVRTYCQSQGSRSVRGRRG